MVFTVQRHFLSQISSLEFHFSVLPDQTELIISPDFLVIRNSNVLAHQSSWGCIAIHQLPLNSISRPRCRRIPRHSHFRNIPYLCGRTRSHCFCKWSLDDCRRISRVTHRSERILAIHILPDRLPTLCL